MRFGRRADPAAPLHVWAALGLLAPLLWALAMPLTFLWQSLPAWRHQGLDLVAGAQWFYRAERFGAASMIFGTAAVSLIAIALAAPLGLAAAVSVHSCLRGRAGLMVKALMELLAGVPSVVYGLLGVMMLRTWMYGLLQPLDPISGDSLLTAGVLLAVMILPTLATLADDVLRSADARPALAARGLGLTRSETLFSVTLPGAARGLWAAVLIALGRALGETIAVFLVVGRQDNQPLRLSSLIEPGQTLTSKLGGSEIHIAAGDSLHWSALMALAVILLAISLLTTFLGLRLAGRRP